MIKRSEFELLMPLRKLSSSYMRFLLDCCNLSRRFGWIGTKRRRLKREEFIAYEERAYRFDNQLLRLYQVSR